MRSQFDTILAHEAAHQGAQLIEDTRVEELVRENGRLIGIKTNQGNLRKKHLFFYARLNPERAFIISIPHKTICPLPSAFSCKIF
ncbi:hypothetical protein NIES4071_35770 [Calothrix sp. NIES-4071]|nr:hypothetical protein NIES4071_35770 [Calothrix sp. NIES-4071]BAZ57896.1 hypothetical protein NIES4105_35700 [Calothrix sp. NIES-4105]